MIRLLQILRADDRAAAATEMALALPLLLVLIWGPLEIGNYFLNQHMLIKGVRDGATFAAHQDIANYDCSVGSPTVPQAIQDKTLAIVRTGQLSGGTDRLRNWTAGTTSFTMALTCVTQSTGGTALSGIYALNGGKVPIVSIDASLPYASILGNLGFRPATLTVNAKQQATVMGI